MVTLTTPAKQSCFHSYYLMLVGCTTALSKNGFETLRVKSQDMYVCLNGWETLTYSDRNIYLRRRTKISS